MSACEIEKIERETSVYNRSMCSMGILPLLFILLLQIVRVSECVCVCERERKRERECVNVKQAKLRHAASSQAGM